jgi:hypothetical protein
MTMELNHHSWQIIPPGTPGIDWNRAYQKIQTTIDSGQDYDPATVADECGTGGPVDVWTLKTLDHRQLTAADKYGWVMVRARFGDSVEGLSAGSEEQDEYLSAWAQAIVRFSLEDHHELFMGRLEAQSIPRTKFYGIPAVSDSYMYRWSMPLVILVALQVSSRCSPLSQEDETVVFLALTGDRINRQCIGQDGTPTEPGKGDCGDPAARAVMGCESRATSPHILFDEAGSEWQPFIREVWRCPAWILAQERNQPLLQSAIGLANLGEDARLELTNPTPRGRSLLKAVKTIRAYNHAREIKRASKTTR